MILYDLFRLLEYLFYDEVLLYELLRASVIQYVSEKNRFFWILVYLVKLFDLRYIVVLVEEHRFHVSVVLNIQQQPFVRQAGTSLEIEFIDMFFVILIRRVHGHDDFHFLSVLLRLKRSFTVASS